MISPFKASEEYPGEFVTELGWRDASVVLAAANERYALKLDDNEQMDRMLDIAKTVIEQVTGTRKLTIEGPREYILTIENLLGWYGVRTEEAASIGDWDLDTEKVILDLRDERRHLGEAALGLADEFHDEMEVYQAMTNFDSELGTVISFPPDTSASSAAA